MCWKNHLILKHQTRIVLNLEGVCRFILNEHLNRSGYYMAKIKTNDFVDDLNNIEPQIDRKNLIQKYSNFFKMKKLEIDREVYQKHQIFNSFLH